MRKVNTATAVLLLLSAATASGSEPDAAAAGERWHRVAEVLSGDRFKLEGGATVRYASVSAPDPLSPLKRIEEFARESTEFNRSLVEGKRVRLVWGSRIRDAKGNYVAYVHTEDGAFANLRVLEEGYAKLVIDPPNLEHADELRAAASAARRGRKGLWRHEKDRSQEPEFVGDKMKRLYHFADCPLLDDVPKGHRQDLESSVDAKSKNFGFCKLCKERPSQYTDLF